VGEVGDVIGHLHRDAEGVGPRPQSIVNPDGAQFVGRGDGLPAETDAVINVSVAKTSGG
jgi:hypothetical protein